MPTMLQVRKHWCNNLVKKKGFDSTEEFMEAGVCFACGMSPDSDTPSGGLEKAHITAKVEGGSDLPENIHLLCSICHKDSEYLDGEKYWAWFYQRTSIDMMMSAAARKGANIHSLIGLN